MLLALQAYQRREIHLALFLEMANLLIGKCSEAQATVLLAKLINNRAKIDVELLNFFKMLIEKGGDPNIRNDRGSLLSLAYYADIKNESSEQDKTTFFNFLKQLINNPKFKPDSLERFLNRTMGKFSADEKLNKTWNTSWVEIVGVLIEKHPSIYAEKCDHNYPALEYVLWKMEKVDNFWPFYRVAFLMIKSPHYNRHDYHPGPYGTAMEKLKGPSNPRTTYWDLIRSAAYEKLSEEEKDAIRAKTWS